MLKDFLTYHVTFYPIQTYVTYDSVSPSNATFLSAISNENESTNFQEANSKSVWKQAIKEELQALDENKTWIIVKLSLEKKSWGAVEYTRSNITVMIPLNAIRQD